MDRGDGPASAPNARATRCQLLLAVLFLFGFSAACWLLVARFVF